MHADSRGKGDAVLLIHGMPTNGRLWDGVVRELSRRHKCIVIDLPGTGNTPFLPYGPSSSYRWPRISNRSAGDTGYNAGMWWVTTAVPRLQCNTPIYSPSESIASHCFRLRSSLTCSRSFCSTCSASPFWANFLLLS